MAWLCLSFLRQANSVPLEFHLFGDPGYNKSDLVSAISLPFSGPDSGKTEAASGRTEADYREDLALLRCELGILYVVSNVPGAGVNIFCIAPRLSLDPYSHRNPCLGGRRCVFWLLNAVCHRPISGETRLLFDAFSQRVPLTGSGGWKIWTG